jgi:CDP-diglyceride synthetase
MITSVAAPQNWPKKTLFGAIFSTVFSVVPLMFNTWTSVEQESKSHIEVPNLLG